MTDSRSAARRAAPTLVLECLAKEPEQGPQDAAALQERLLQLKPEQAWSAAEARACWKQHLAASGSRAAARAEQPS